MLIILQALWYPGYTEEAPAAPGVKIISLKEALDQALVSNLEIRQAAKDVAISQAQADQSNAELYWPNISLNGSVTITNERNDPTNQTSGIIYPQNLSLGLSVSKTLFQGFVLWNNTEIARKNLALTRFTYDDKVNQIRLSVTTAFYQLLLLKEAYDLAEFTAKNLSSHLLFAEESFKRGKISELELLTAQVNFKSNVPKLIKARNDYEVQKLNLCQLIGLENSQGIEFSADWKEIEGMGMENQNEDEAYRAVLAHDAALEAADVSITLAELKRTNTGNARFPTLSASFSYRFISSRNSLDFLSQGLNPYWNLGLSLSVPIDDLLPFSKTAFSIQEMEETVVKQRLARDQRVRDLTLQFKTQFLQLNELKASVAALEESKNLAMKGLELVEAQMKKGSSTPLTVADAELAYRTAIYAYRQALFTYAGSIWTLNYMIGK